MSMRSLSHIVAVVVLIASLMLPVARLAEAELLEDDKTRMVPPGKYCGTFEIFGFMHLLIEVSNVFLSHHLCVRAI